MKKKIIDMIVDIALITVAFMATDSVVNHLLHSENFWLELGVYAVFYAIVFGAKAGIVHLWKKRK